MAYFLKKRCQEPFCPGSVYAIVTSAVDVRLTTNLRACHTGAGMETKNGTARKRQGKGNPPDITASTAARKGDTPATRVGLGKAGPII